MTTNKKITELTELVEADIADDDVLPIVDVSAGETFKVRKSTLSSALAGVSSVSATTPVATDQSTGAVTVSLGTVPIDKGGTGATTASAARTALGVLEDPMTTRGDIIRRGSAATERLALGSSGTVLKSDGSDIAYGNVAATELTGTLPVANGGTNATTASAARTSLGAAASGSNSDITELTGLTTDLDVTHGGTGASTASAARTNLGAAASGANSDITSITGLTTDLSVAQGGTGASTFADNGVLFGNGTSAIGATAVGTSGHVLTSNGAGYAPTFQEASGGAILQVRRKNLGYFSSTSINGTVTVTNWDDDITMSSASNAILAIIGGTKTFGICVGNNLMYTYLFRDGVQTSATALNSGTVIGEIAAYFSSQNYTMSNTIHFLEKPNTTSAITYSVRPYGNTGAQQSSAMTWSNTHLTLIELDGSLVTINP